MEQEEIQGIEGLRQELEQERSKNTSLNTSLASVYSRDKDPNAMIYQLDAEEILSRIEHYLKGEKILEDQYGNESFESKEEDRIFNDYGVNALMNILGNYIHKYTILSNYNEERINEICSDLGNELSKFIFINYEKMGLIDEFRKSKFTLVVLNILHFVETTYRRALYGQTLKEINTSRIFSQIDNNAFNKLSSITNPIKKKFNPLKPSTW